VSTEEISFELVNHYKYNERGANGEWYASLSAELVTYYRGQRWGQTEISVAGQAYSESAALADVQFKFQQKLEILKQEKRASFSSQSSSYSSYSPSSYSYSSGSRSSRNVSNYEQFVSLLWMLLSCAIAIVVMRSTFPTYFPTRNWFPANAPDWITTIFLGLIPIPIGWVAWITFFVVGGIGALVIVALFREK
jgi:hypothetical protein